jgi:hypothetical protein
MAADAADKGIEGLLSIASLAPPFASRHARLEMQSGTTNAEKGSTKYANAKTADTLAKWNAKMQANVQIARNTSGSDGGIRMRILVLPNAM